VAGVAARLLSGNPTRTPVQVRSPINASATTIDVGLSAQGDPNGLLHAESDTAAPVAPSIPTSVTAVRSNSRATERRCRPSVSRTIVHEPRWRVDPAVGGFIPGQPG
jgi:hypothetical protein